MVTSQTLQKHGLVDLLRQRLRPSLFYKFLASVYENGRTNQVDSCRCNFTNLVIVTVLYAKHLRQHHSGTVQHNQLIL